MQRTKLVPCDNFIFTNSKSVDEKQLTPDTFDAAKKLEKEIRKAGGNFVLNTVFRSWAKQQSLVDLHTKDPSHHAFAAPPGGSYHQAGRALDINLNVLNFPDLPKSQWLSKLWTIAISLGFRPIIATPNMEAEEAWHFDYIGFWKNVHDKMGNAISAQCAILDVGNWNPQTPTEQTRNMFIQAQLLRLGCYEIGNIDGIIGSKSLQAIKDLGITASDLDKVAKCLVEKK